MIARPDALRDSSAIHDLRARQVALLLGCRAKWEKTGGEPIHLRAHEPMVPAWRKNTGQGAEVSLGNGFDSGAEGPTTQCL